MTALADKRLGAGYRAQSLTVLILVDSAKRRPCTPRRQERVNEF
jgi:hypothetical protein